MPYYAFRMKGYHVTLASIKGGEIPFDPASVQSDRVEVKAFLQEDGESCNPAGTSS